MGRLAVAQVGRAEVLAYRAAVQQLTEQAPRLDEVAVLGIGVQDTPRGSAQLALRARANGAPTSTGLRTAMLARGAPHVVRGSELPFLTAAFGPLDDEDATRIDDIAAAMREAVGDAAGISRPDLSEALNGLVHDDLRTWCERCGSRHVPEGVFRTATARAGLVLAPDDAPVRFVPDGSGSSTRAEPAGAEARAELVRRFVHLLGPTRPAHLAAWLGYRTGEVSGLWALISDDLVPVGVDGSRCAMLRSDVDALTGASRPRFTRLLPPLDPYLLGDRNVVVLERDDQRRIWRAIGSPGVLVADGEVAGTWRQRLHRDTLQITVTPFGPLAAATRDALAAEAAAVGSSRGEPDTVLDVERPVRGEDVL